MIRRLSSKQVFWLIFASILAVKFVLAWKIPMTGDEAYYIVWGKRLAGGYYDQPPMIGWWLGALLKISDHAVFLRLPAILLSSLMTLGSLWILKETSAFPHRSTESSTSREDRAYIGATFFALMPIHILPVFMTTDTPLIFFSFSALVALFFSLRRNSTWLAGLAGSFLGAAFLSKYFAILIPAAFFGYLLCSKSPRKHFGKFLALGLGMTPAILFHLYWNYENCWINFIFNLRTRNENEQFDPRKILQFIAYQLYLVTPFLLVALFKGRKIWRQCLELEESRFLLAFYLLPILAFAASAWSHGQGLHWTFSFYPALYLLAALTLTIESLKKTTTVIGIFSLAHLLIITAALVTPRSVWMGLPYYKSIQLFKFTQEVVQPLEQFKENYHFSTDGYTLGSILAYASKKPFSIFGAAGRYGRQDDLDTDFRTLDTKNILYFTRTPPDLSALESLFSEVELKQFELFGVRYFFVLGNGFRFERYREKYLSAIRSKYYSIPTWVPVKGCYFLDRYFPLWRQESSSSPAF